MIDQIKKQWSEHETTPFPDGHTGMKEGLNLFVLSAEIGALIASYLASGGALTAYRQNRLRSYLDQLSPVIERLPQHGQPYFQSLVNMGMAILGQLEQSGEVVQFRLKKP